MATIAASSATVSAQTPPAAEPVCRLRISVLESYAPFAAAIPAAKDLNAQTTGSEARAALSKFDAAVARAIAQAPAGGEATLALVDLERVIDTAAGCGNNNGWPSTMASAGTALYAAFKRNQSTLSNPEYASRLLRSKTAQAVLRDNGQGAAIDNAPAIAARQQEQQKIANAEAAAKMREQQALILANAEAQRNAWRSNASAPAAGANVCDNAKLGDFSNKPKDQIWLMALDREASSGCVRVSDRRDGVFYSGLALGTDVTDEQLAHAAGKQFLCFSNSAERKIYDQMIALTNKSAEMFQLGDIYGFGLKPNWREGQNGKGNRVVTIGCQTKFDLFGMDMSQMADDFANRIGADRQQYIQFELEGTRLLSVRLHSWIANEASSQTSEDYYTKSSSTTHICDPALARAQDIGFEWRRSGAWQISQQLPYQFTSERGAARSGQWMVLKRGALTADIWNVSYDAPVLGESGSCYGGVVEHYVTLTAERATKIKAGAPPQF